MSRPKPRHVRAHGRKKATACGKRRFRDQLEAKSALRTIRTDGSPRRDRTPARAYHCHICKGWHLTSQA